MSKRARVVAAGEFKAKCLELMDVVAESGDAIVITKRGKPVAQLVPVDDAKPPLLGSMKGLIEITGDILSPLDVDWGPKEPDIPRRNRRRLR